MGSDDLDRFLENWMAMPQLTLKREKKEILPFLDMLIKQEKDSFPKKMYRKENHAQEWTPCDSFRLDPPDKIGTEFVNSVIHVRARSAVTAVVERYGNIFE